MSSYCSDGLAVYGRQWGQYQHLGSRGQVSLCYKLRGERIDLGVYSQLKYGGFDCNDGLAVLGG